MADGTLHSTSHVRTANAVRIVQLLREQGAMSRAELVRASGLTKPTVMAIVSVASPALDVAVTVDVVS